MEDIKRALDLLDADVLDGLNSKDKVDLDDFGRMPLLKYAAEALTEYAGLIYDRVIPCFGVASVTREEYVDTWLSPYSQINKWMSSDIVDRLAEILKISDSLRKDYINFAASSDCENFTDSLCHLLSPLRDRNMDDKKALALISEIDDMRCTCSKALDDFIRKEIDKYKSLCTDRSRYLKLQQKDITLLTKHKDKLPQEDWRLISQALDAKMVSARIKKIVVAQLKYINRTLTVLSANRDKLQQISLTRYILSDEDYNVIAQLLKKSTDWDLDTDRLIAAYDANIKTCIASREYKSICTDIDVAVKLLTYLTDLTPQVQDYGDVGDRLNIYVALAQQKTVQDGKALIQSYADLHIVMFDIYELFIRHFAAQIEHEYAMLKLEDVFDFDDANNVCQTVYIDYEAVEAEIQKRANIRVKLARDGLSEYWFDDYNYSDIAKLLADCLRVALNGISPDVVLSQDAQSHGAVMGMLLWAQDIKALIYDLISSGKALDFDYKQLANGLRHQLQYQTLMHNDADYMKLTSDACTVVKGQSEVYAKDRFNVNPFNMTLHDAYYGFTKICNIVPLPVVQPVRMEQIRDAVANTPIQADDADNQFDITAVIGERMDRLGTTAVITAYEEVVLCETDVQSLMSVPDRTIIALLSTFAGRRCDAYMLHGDLIACTDDGQYTKILPKKSEDGYASYRFIAINWDVLSSLIYKHVELLRNTVEYDDWIREAVAERPIINGRESILAKQLARQASNYDEDVSLLSQLRDTAIEEFADTHKMGGVANMARTKYFENLFISQHRLVTWVYMPDDYKKISQMQVDSQGKIIKYHIDHMDRIRDNNCPTNLRVITQQLNAVLTSNSIKVKYNEQEYLSLSDYCTATSAGNYNNLRQCVSGLLPGDIVEYKDRVYMLGEARHFTVTDADTPQQGICVNYNDETYTTLSAFASAASISYSALRKRLSRAQTDGVTDFIYKKLKITLSGNGDIKVTPNK